MSNYQENVEMVRRLPGLMPDRLHEASDVISEDFRWSYFNEALPNLDKKTYIGIDGWEAFFQDLADLTGGTFSVSIVDAYALGSEFVIAHAKPTMTLDGMTFETDAAVVWRIVDGKITEAWDIPGINSAITNL